MVDCNYLTVDEVKLINLIQNQEYMANSIDSDTFSLQGDRLAHDAHFSIQVSGEWVEFMVSTKYQCVKDENNLIYLKKVPYSKKKNNGNLANKAWETHHVLFAESELVTSSGENVEDVIEEWFELPLGFSQYSLERALRGYIASIGY